MRKSQIIIVGIAIIAVIFLFNLPKILVKDQRQAKTGDTQGKEISQGKEESHDMKIPEKDQLRLNSLRKSYLSVSDKKKKLKFADSLAVAFRNVNKYDSAAKYLGEIASLEPQKENLVKAGDAYFDASTFALDQNKSANLGENARVYYEKALEKDSSDLDVKTKYAKTYIGTEQTMAGIRMLREVIISNPKHEEALFTLGIASIQSRQFDKAVERFEEIVKNNPNNLDAMFRLGYSYMELGEKKKAKAAFENVKKLSKDPEVQATIDAYLKELK